MEKAGTIKVLNELAASALPPVESVTIDKNASVAAELARPGLVDRYDPWHWVRGVVRRVRAEMSRLKRQPDDRDILQSRMLGRRQADLDPAASQSTLDSTPPGTAACARRTTADLAR